MKSMKPAKIVTAPEKIPAEGAAEELVDETKPMKSIDDMRKVFKQKFGPKRTPASSSGPAAKGKGKMKGC